MWRYFRVFLNAALLAVVIGQVWSIRTCPFMTDPSQCTTYPAGCGLLCTPYVPLTPEYKCCCGVWNTSPLSVIGCCEATCQAWQCVLFNPIPQPPSIPPVDCGIDVHFDQTSYHPNHDCLPPAQQNYPMQGWCYPRPTPTPPSPAPPDIVPVSN